VNGNPTATRTTDVTGLIVIPVAAGDSDVHIYFRRTNDRLAGNIISFISLVVFLVAWSGPAWIRMQKHPVAEKLENLAT
jgi:hypothetical protein